jgi:hypothetical protein
MLLQKLQQFYFIQALVKKVFAVFDNLHERFRETQICQYSPSKRNTNVSLRRHKLPDEYLETNVAIIRKIDTKQCTAENRAVQELNELISTLKIKLHARSAV